ncbi:hypothetical protein C3Y87_08340 [Carbonactinospora thermoautotrophica]|uniref:aminoglycoside phosphotransferase family protein n=1 Tax=Carbonactinospora thermoautotrophica TaxID=1469144 RepID=UPI00226EC33C|nr:phosphotransferase [Carbonactinospora thermoautotrophica]MCX9191422.1 hypothetical protein [Carbonactinospora thermoautotrophica]
MTAAEPLDLYRAATRNSARSAGFYNSNVRVDTPSGPMVVRIPIPGADVMDLRIWPEYQVLGAVASYVEHVPKLVHVSQEPMFQVYEFVPGDLLDDVAPRGVEVPRFVLTDVIELFTQLTRVPRDHLPPSPSWWPDDGDTAGFANILSSVTRDVWDRFQDEFASLYRELGVPSDPLEPVLEGWKTLHSRPFRLVHSDVHRKNMILCDGHVVFLDWELALWGDPVYDLAVHLHKMAYQPAEQDAVVRRWQERLPRELTAGWQQDLPTYLTHERVKSAIVDAVRYAKLFAVGGLSSQREKQLVRSLTGKVNAARAIWGHDRMFDDAKVEAVLRRRASG